MILYHFTAKHLARKIKKEGLTLGGLPLSLNPPRIEWGWIWLTSKSGFDQECLEGTGRLPYKRNEVRITVKFPDLALGCLYKFDEHKNLTPLYEDMTMFGDPENWWLYKGKIPKGWLKKFDNKPTKASEGKSSR